MHLAQLNIGRMKYDLEDPRAGDFLGGIDIINRIAVESPGFVWKYETEPGGVVEEEVDGDPFMLVNMSVWENVASLEHFVWNTLHKRFLARKAEWFKAMDVVHLVMWWVPRGHEPDLDEAMERLDHRRAYGDSDHAFGWDHARAMSASVEGVA